MQMIIFNNTRTDKQFFNTSKKVRLGTLNFRISKKACEYHLDILMHLWDSGYSYIKTLKYIYKHLSHTHRTPGYTGYPYLERPGT